MCCRAGTQRNKPQKHSQTQIRSNSAVSQAGFVTTAFDSANDDPGDGVQQADHADEEVYNRIRTSTIKLTPNLASRLAQPALENDGKKSGLHRAKQPAKKAASDEPRDLACFRMTMNRNKLPIRKRVLDGTSAELFPIDGATSLWCHPDRFVNPFPVAKP